MATPEKTEESTTAAAKVLPTDDLKTTRHEVTVGGETLRYTATTGRVVLRFEPVTPFTARICLEQVEHRDVVFPAGTIVAVSAERANRQHEDGETFDITAPREGRLLTFGAGTHYCLGANLARAELEEALAFLAPRTPGLVLDGLPQLGGVEGIYGVDKLPITWSDSSTMSPNHGPAPDVS